MKSQFVPALEKAHQKAATENANNVKPRQAQSRKSDSTKPKPKKGKSSLTVTDKPCPVCDSFLAEKSYTKNGETKKMLVCSSGNRDRE